MSPLPPLCRSYRRALAVALLAGLPLRLASAQGTRTLTACTPDALAVCTELRLTAGSGLFDIQIRSLGAAGQPSLPVSVYNLVLGTGATAAVTPTSVLVTPVAVAGATLTDASPWDLFDAGDAFFLSALTNAGVGGCVAGAPVGGFAQAGTTCGAAQFLAFRFAPTTVFDPRRFTLLNLEAVGLAAGLPAASCGGEDVPCRITADVSTPGAPSTTAPEPATIGLVGTGLLLLLVRAAARPRVV